MNKRRAILWFRNDLRWHDNEAVKEISRSADEVIPIYIFDEREFFDWQKGPYPKIFRTRIKFILESLEDLRQNLRKRGSELYIRIGRTEEILFDLAKNYGSTGVFCSRERMPRQAFIQDALESKLWSVGQELYLFRGRLLFNTSDLPFPIARMPDLFSAFRKEMEQIIPVREEIDMTDIEIALPETDLDPGEIPSLNDFGYVDFSNDDFKGGETSGLRRLDTIMKEISNGYDGAINISPWLSNGNVSSKRLYHRLNGLPESVEPMKNRLIRNLLLRDYYHLIANREPESLFRPGGFRNNPEMAGEWDEKEALVWMRGETGEDLIDNSMHCLFHTGYLEHSRRKAVAQYFLEEMGLHWQLGAGYFESVMLDYDPTSNYGNWQRQAGIGTDLKGRHSVNLLTLKEQEDPDNEFQKRWKTAVVDYDFEYYKEHRSVQLL